MSLKLRVASTVGGYILTGIEGDGGGGGLGGVGKRGGKGCIDYSKRK